LDEAAHNGERIGIDDENEEGAECLKTGGSARGKKTDKMEPAEDFSLSQ